MRCPGCGAGNSKRATECSQCGAELVQEEKPRPRRTYTHPSHQPGQVPVSGPKPAREFLDSVLAEIRGNLK